MTFPQMTPLERLRAWLSAFEPYPDAPRMETPDRPLLNPPTFEQMWATVERRKP